MVDMVAAVRRLRDGRLDGLDGGMVYRRAHAVVYQVVAAVADWSIWSDGCEDGE